MTKYILARIRKKIALLAIVSILATSVFASFSQVNFNTFALGWDSDYENYTVWNGNVASSYAGGTGTENDPFMIANVEQLAKMVKDGGKNSSNKSAYFKVADGIDALCINDVIKMNLDETVEYMQKGDGVKEWFYNSTGFVGKFDGNGVTICGLYNNSESKKGGLFGTLQSNAFIYNVTLKNNVIIATDETTNIGVISGESEGRQIIIKNVSVIDSYIRGRWTAAFIGTTKTSHIEFANCFAANIDIDYNGKGVTNSGGAGGVGGLLADCIWGSGYVTITDCFTKGIYPVCYNAYNCQTSNIIYTDVYTDVDLMQENDYDSLSQSAKTKFETIKLITKDESTGKENPIKNMNFDWEKEWNVTDGYPRPNVHVVNNGTVGGTWSGDVADVFSGLGTSSSPFIIDTAERFARMASLPKKGAYYKITADIILNDVTDSQWYKNSSLNVWNFGEMDFNANINGFINDESRNAIICGVYIPSVKAEESVGLFSRLVSNSTIKNITLSNSYFNGVTSTKKQKGSTIGAIVGEVVENATGISISGCMVEDTVIINDSANAGGIFGTVSGMGLVTDCASMVSIVGENDLVGGIVAEVTGALNIINTYCVGSYVSDSVVRTINVYSDVDQKLSKNAPEVDVKLLNKDQMIGENAKTNLVGLNFDSVWSVSDNYPIIIGEPLSFDGIPNEVWLGVTAGNYAGGTGEEEDPYLIATGEQLYKMITSTSAATEGKHFKLINDIKLNDVNSENWENKTTLNSWYAPASLSNPFRGHFDGDYHIVSGIFNDTIVGNTYGLFPIIGEGAVIENVGVTNSYIEISTTSSERYAACIVGYVQGFNKTRAAFEAEGNKVPIVRNCFADHTTHVESRYAGGIVCGVPSYVDVENCFFTGYVLAGDTQSVGSIIGNGWGRGSRITKCYSAPLNVTNFSGNYVILTAKSDDVIYIRDSYALSFRSIFNVTNLPFEKEKYGGQGVKNYATGLDWNSVWATVKGGTPVLRGFDKNGHTLAEFSYKDGYNSTITFITNAPGVSVEPITAEMLSPVILPVPERYGYTFDGWYAYPELDAPYDRDYMLYRDITLYAKWIVNGINQDFENYPNTEYDVGEDYELYKPGVANYNVNNVHAGARSMHRIGLSAENSDFLLNYEDELNLGSEYEMTYWMLSDTPNASVELSLVYNTWPDIEETVSKTEVILNKTGIKKGEWKQYKYKFTAITPWVSIRSSGNTSLYFDDIMIVPTGKYFEVETLVNNNTDNSNSNTDEHESNDSVVDNSNVNNFDDYQSNDSVVDNSNVNNFDDYQSNDSWIDNSYDNDFGNTQENTDDTISDNIEVDEPSAEANQSTESQNGKKETEKKDYSWIIYVSVGVGIFVIGGIVTVLLIRKKKHK